MIIKKTKGRLTRDGATVRRVQVMLDEETIERAKALGDGNVSQGIRQAIASLPTPTKQDERGMMAAQEKGEYMIVAIRPGFGHVEFDGDCYWVIELGFEARHASSVGVRTYETALRHLRSM